MPKFYSNEEVIEVPFPDKVFEIYLKRFNVESEDKLNDINIFEIIGIMVKMGCFFN